MKRTALHFTRLAKGVLYGNLLLSMGTGLLWFCLHRWGQGEGEFGPEKHPLEPWLMRIHGASAFLALTGFGWILAAHVRVAWQSRRNRPLGVTLLTMTGGLAVSGYLLYYASGERLREMVSWTHLALGLALPAVLALHIRAARRQRPRSIASRSSADSG